MHSQETEGAINPEEAAEIQEINEIKENISFLLEENQALQILLARVIEQIGAESKAAESGGVSDDRLPQTGRTPTSGRVLSRHNDHAKPATIRTWIPEEF